MQTNDKLTAAARRGAQGHTAAGIGVFSTLSADKQQALVTSVLQDRKLTEEIVRTSLNAMPTAEVEDMLNAMGETRGSKAFHTGVYGD